MDIVQTDHAQKNVNKEPADDSAGSLFCNLSAKLDVLNAEKEIGIRLRREALRDAQNRGDTISRRQIDFFIQIGYTI